MRNSKQTVSPGPFPFSVARSNPVKLIFQFSIKRYIHIYIYTNINLYLYFCIYIFRCKTHDFFYIFYDRCTLLKGYHTYTFYDRHSNEQARRNRGRAMLQVWVSCDGTLFGKEVVWEVGIEEVSYRDARESNKKRYFTPNPNLAILL